MSTMILYYYYGFDEKSEKKRNEIREVHHLLRKIRDDLYELISEKTSNFYKELNKSIKNKKEGISYTKLFKSSFYETFVNYEVFLGSLEEKIFNDDEMLNLHYQLKEIGFTGNSLKLKLHLLEELWQQLKKSIQDAIIDWRAEKTRIIAIKFLKHLNSLLGSLSKKFPILDVVTEFKEMMETSIDLMNEIQAS